MVAPADGTVAKAEVVEDEVLYAVSEHIATLTLNRPDRMNTISGPMLSQLAQLMLKADRDPDVRCIILTGAGRAFRTLTAEASILFFKCLP